MGQHHGKVGQHHGKHNPEVCKPFRDFEISSVLLQHQCTLFESHKKIEKAVGICVCRQSEYKDSTTRQGVRDSRRITN